ncbi:phosphoglycerate mutase [Streptomyces sp. CB02959]|uniref:histidine phosphatase family protein n=1 Tax=Streptomyces sp. CB02959 TaxID=2020330 RepID=UPI000C27D69E|nr:histidine phosphatase family protein [Streptomyces sp. CB02959]PJN32223.1 phosphoglycerate mutase [Streptomyces sp. CB02959]
MAEVWLMRHGAYEGHRPGHHAPFDAALTQEGRRQVHNALPLPDGIAGIITSPLPRARQTAGLLALLTGLPLLTSTALLAEWRAPSSVLDRIPDNYPPDYRTWRNRRLTEPDLRFEDGESLADLHTRAARCACFLRHAARTHGSILAVSHKLILGVLTRLPEGPTAFATATTDPWHFAERRRFTTPWCAQADNAPDIEVHRANSRPLPDVGLDSNKTNRYGEVG